MWIWVGRAYQNDLTPCFGVVLDVESDEVLGESTVKGLVHFGLVNLAPALARLCVVCKFGEPPYEGIHEHGGQDLKQWMQVKILTPINSQRYLRSADDDRGEEGTQCQYPCFPHHVDHTCASAMQRALRYTQLTAGGAEKASL